MKQNKILLPVEDMGAMIKSNFYRWFYRANPKINPTGPTAVARSAWVVMGSNYIGRSLGDVSFGLSPMRYDFTDLNFNVMNDKEEESTYLTNLNFWPEDPIANSIFLVPPGSMRYRGVFAYHIFSQSVNWTMFHHAITEENLNNVIPLGVINPIEYPAKSINFINEDRLLILDKFNHLWKYRPMVDSEAALVFSVEEAVDIPVLFVNNDFYIRDRSIDNYDPDKGEVRPFFVEDIPPEKRKIEVGQFLKGPLISDGSTDIKGLIVLNVDNTIWRDIRKVSYFTFPDRCNFSQNILRRYSELYTTVVESKRPITIYDRYLNAADVVLGKVDLITGTIAIHEDGQVYSTNNVGNGSVLDGNHDNVPFQPIANLTNVRFKSIVPQIDYINSGTRTKTHSVLNKTLNTFVESKAPYNYLKNPWTMGLIDDENNLWLCGRHCGIGGRSRIGDRRDLLWLADSIFNLPHSLSGTSGKFNNVYFFYESRAMMAQYYMEWYNVALGGYAPHKFFNDNRLNKIVPSPFLSQSESFVKVLSNVKKAYIVGDYVFALRMDGTLMVTGGSGDAITRAVLRRIETMDIRDEFGNVVPAKGIYIDGRDAWDTDEQNYYKNFAYSRPSIHQYAPFTKESILQMYTDLYHEEDQDSPKQVFIKVDESNIDQYYTEESTVIHDYNGQNTSSLFGSLSDRFDPFTEALGTKGDILKYLTGISPDTFDYTTICIYDFRIGLKDYNATLTTFYNWNFSDSKAYTVNDAGPYLVGRTEVDGNVYNGYFATLESVYMDIQGYTEYAPNFIPVRSTKKIEDFWCGLNLMFAKTMYEEENE